MTVGLLAQQNLVHLTRRVDEIRRLSAAVAQHLREDGIRMVFSGAGDVRAYVLYRSLTPDQERQYQEAGLRYPTFEPTHGPARTWIIDMGCPYGVERRLLRQLAALIPPSIERACYLRRGSESPVVREIEIARFRSNRPALADGERPWPGQAVSSGHAILNLSNVTQLFEDSSVPPEGFFHALCFNRDLGDLLEFLPRRRWPTGNGHYESIGSLTRKVRLRQFYIHRSPAGRALAGLTWAWISPRTLQRLTHHPRRALSIYELNDGRSLLMEASGPVDADPQPLFNRLRQDQLTGIDEMYFRSGAAVHRINLSDVEALRRAWVATATPEEPVPSGDKRLDSAGGQE